MEWLIFLQVVGALFVGYLLGWVIKWWRKRQQKRLTDDRETYSLDLLYETPRVATTELLQRAAREVFGVELGPASNKDTEFAFVEQLVGFIKVSEWMIMVTCFPEPMVDDVEQAASEIGELVTAHAFSTHTNYWNVAVMGHPAEKSADEIYAVLGKIVAELCDDTVVLLAASDIERLNIPTTETLQLLRDGQTIEAMREIKFDAVPRFRKDHQGMNDAIAEAKARLPEFLDAFRADPTAPGYLFKGRFSDDVHTEFMWLTPISLTETHLTGTLENTPFNLKGMKSGDIVSVPLEHISDWLYSKDGKPVGLFTTGIEQGL